MLPTEIKTQIFSNLNARALRNAALVCHNWLEIINSFPRNCNWKLTIHDQSYIRCKRNQPGTSRIISDLAKPTKIAMILNSRRRFTHIQAFTNTTSYAFTLAELHEICLPNVNYLTNLSVSTYADLPESITFAIHLPDLRELTTLEFNHYGQDATQSVMILLEIVNDLPKLTSLTFPSTYITPFQRERLVNLEPLKYIQKLEVVGATGSAFYTSLVARKCKELRHYTLQAKTTMYHANLDKAFNDLNLYNQKLTTLHIKGKAANIPKAALKNLTTLIIHDISLNPIAHEVLANNKQLKTIIFHADGWTPQALPNVLHALSFPHIQTVTLKGRHWKTIPLLRYLAPIKHTQAHPITISDTDPNAARTTFINRTDVLKAKARFDAQGRHIGQNPRYGRTFICAKCNPQRPRNRRGPVPP